MTKEQIAWWSDLIENATATTDTRCPECASLRTQIATHNYQIAAASRAARNEECTKEKREKNKVIKLLKTHLRDVTHDTFRIRIVSDVLDKWQRDGSNIEREMDFTASAPSAPQRVRTSPPVPVDLADSSPRVPDPWLCFAGRPKPMVISGTSMPPRLRTNNPPIKVGDMAVFMVSTHRWWTLPWQVGKVLELNVQDEEIKVRLYGNHAAKATGIFHPGWWHHQEQAAAPPAKKRRKRGRGSYSRPKKKTTGAVVTDYPYYGKKTPTGPYEPYTLTLGPDSIIDWNFKLRSKGELKKSVLKVIDHNPRVAWSISA